ncbi:MAG: 2-amino-4-hydroxy-6-hydroxymethyldihydropteridine diphosphokinase [Flavobacteriales bacterium]|nr:MAG: 2-amino-4-hydroxy-6-hydroxymethyldihydropteridine diphosphokinase [Flavobacteriales bacterium]
MKINKTAWLSLGSNMGNKLHNLQAAIELLHKKAGSVNAVSSVYETAAWGFSGNNFLNICCKIQTWLSPNDLLEVINLVETKLGRIRTLSQQRYTDRLIDIDILLYDDVVINTKNLIIPHPKMAARKFVLLPLAEIAKNVIHPLKKIPIHSLLDRCKDKEKVILTGLKINTHAHFKDKYNFIAIEGNIGAGKTTLSKKIGEEYNAKLVLERFADNPFLPKFYADMERYAFPLEMSFLADRFQQLSEDLAQYDLFKSFVVADYFIIKSLLFAQVSLSEDEYALYNRIFNIMYGEITKPDLYVFLYQNTDGLIKNIKKRDRPYEQNIQPEYLDKINKGYLNFIHTNTELNSVIIDVTDLDFENNNADYEKVKMLMNR